MEQDLDNAIAELIEVFPLEYKSSLYSIVSAYNLKLDFLEEKIKTLEMIKSLYEQKDEIQRRH